MEQCSNGDQSFLPQFVSANELEVSEILLRLPQLIVETTPLRPSLSWGATRKRSVLESTPPPVSFSFFPSPFVPGSGVSEHKRESESPPMAANKVVALSPATPLAFFPSETDERPKSSEKKSALKKKKEEWVGFVDGLTQRRDSLKGELETVKDYYYKLKTFNLKLKARKQKINAHAQLVIESELANLKLESSPASVVDYPPSLMKDQTNCGFGAKDLNLSHLGIPDLNISLDESQCSDSAQALDISRAAMAAQARQKRIQIYRMKNSAAVKPRLSSR